MQITESDRRQIAVAQEYFRRVDAGRADLTDLMTEDVELYFPKFGIGRGKAAFGEFAVGVGRVFESVEHDFRTYSFFCSGMTLVVEGTTRGRMKNGSSWAAGETPGGRFCNVFQFRGDLISRVYIYLDPDYVSEDTPRFLWGREGRTW
jgi:ketosteroid isomerase-like protein